MAPCKILMLHGYTSNATIFSQRLGAIRRACKDVAQFVFVDAPHIVKETTDLSDGARPVQSTDDLSKIPPGEIPRAWWFALDPGPDDEGGLKHYKGFDESMWKLRGVLEREGPFDGCWGFSQGAALAGILTSALLNPSLHPALSSPSSSPHPSPTDPSCPTSTPLQSPNPKLQPFKFSIITSGFMSADRKTHGRYYSWAEDGYISDDPRPLNGEGEEGSERQGKVWRKGTRTLHVLGRNDVIVSEERSKPLIECFVDSRVEWHDGGHFVPSKASWRSFFRDYISSFSSDSEPLSAKPDKDVVSPIDRGTSTPSEDAAGKGNGMLGGKVEDEEPSKKGGANVKL